MALPDGKEPDIDLLSPSRHESGIARRRSRSARDMTDRPSGPAPSGVAHSILPLPGEVEAVDGAWGDDDAEPTQPPSEPPTLRRSESLEFDIPKAARLPALVPPASAADSPYDVAEIAPPPPSGPPTLRITSSPPSNTASSRPSSAPGYGYRASQRPDLAGEMKARFAGGDFSGALLFAEAVLAADPSHEDASLYASSCRVGLAEAYLAEVGTRASVPFVTAGAGALIAHDLDPEHGFVVSQIDGMATIDELIDVCGKPEHETLRVLHDLWRRDVVGIKR